MIAKPEEMDVRGMRRPERVPPGTVNGLPHRRRVQPQEVQCVAPAIIAAGMLLFVSTMGAFIIKIVCIVSTLAQALPDQIVNGTPSCAFAHTLVDTRIVCPDSQLAQHAPVKDCVTLRMKHVIGMHRQEIRGSARILVQIPHALYWDQVVDAHHVFQNRTAIITSLMNVSGTQICTGATTSFTVTVRVATVQVAVLQGLHVTRNLSFVSGVIIISATIRVQTTLVRRRVAVLHARVHMTV